MPRDGQSHRRDGLLRLRFHNQPVVHRPGPGACGRIMDIRATLCKMIGRPGDEPAQAVAAAVPSLRTARAARREKVHTMGDAPQLCWLPAEPALRARLRALDAEPASAAAWAEAMALANTRLDFVLTNALDTVVQRRLEGPQAGSGARPVRLAVLGSSTTAHLHAALRVAALRIWLSTFEPEYGQYWPALLDPHSALHAFRPDAVLFALDARHLTRGINAASCAAECEAHLSGTMQRLAQCWETARAAWGCQVLQQTVLNVFPSLMGSNEQRLPGSPRTATAALNGRLRSAADAAGVDLVELDDRAARDGLHAWHDPALWHRSKQDVALPATPMYGELVTRVLAARQGLSRKCLVLDLDNTLWGGVIGDDGLSGIVLGQGSALGEGFAAVQEHALQLSRRGVILAVSSKNDEANALEPFDSHPEMVLRRRDIATFRADWNDKAANIRAIAHDLNIGLDALVFLDDNPFERALVRQELPMVAVPEVPEDPALVPQVLADAGYFEGVGITEEDRSRTSQYQGNIARETLRATATDMDGYLRSLEMQLLWRRFDDVGLSRVTQLINKTNQFNLTTRRYTAEEVAALMADPDSVGLQLRLVDRFGDNGIIGVVIARLPEHPQQAGDVEIDTWLMSCRVLGRQVEAATLNLLAAEARRLGGRRLLGRYVPTKKNGMVQNHYAALGFRPLARAPDGTETAALDLEGFVPRPLLMTVREG